MARKSKSSPAEDIMEIVAALPWWLGVALAVLSHVLLAGAAQAPIASAARPDQMAGLLSGVLWRSLAGVGQFLIPLLCLVGAAVSAVRARQRRSLLGQVGQHDKAAALAALQALSWQQFELVIGQWFRTQGYSVTEQGGGGADGGIDLRLAKGGEQFVVQCKQWRATKVGVTVVRELYGVMAACGAAGGFVVTTGRFTVEATDFASGRNVQLLDGAQLARMMGTAPVGAPTTPPRGGGFRPSPTHGALCPQCGSAMVLRTAKRGANAGAQFFGCITYPHCRGTRPA
ncbi:MAG: restriction endonuclease [Pseudomonadota bacterium]